MKKEYKSPVVEVERFNLQNPNIATSIYSDGGEIMGLYTVDGEFEKEF